MALQRKIAQIAGGSPENSVAAAAAAAAAMPDAAPVAAGGGGGAAMEEDAEGPNVPPALDCEPFSLLVDMQSINRTVKAMHVFMRGRG